MADSIGYSLVTITEGDSESVLDFLKKFFFKDEPVNVCIGLHDDGWVTEDEKFCLGVISEGISLKAVSSTGNIIGICLNRIIHRQGPKPKEEECNHPKFLKIEDLLNKIYRESDIFGRFPGVDEFLDIKVIAIDGAYRGQGIGKALIEKTRKMAHKRGLPLVIHCTSHFTSLAAARLGFQLLYTLKYADHKDENGKPIFTPEHPHTSAQTYVYPNKVKCKP